MFALCIHSVVWLLLVHITTQTIFCELLSISVILMMFGRATIKVLTKLIWLIYILSCKYLESFE